ncbi:ABC transporter permease [Streptosporangium pseudovulgare]|uniref:ABC transporter permease n=1 Tax=Streptosporangium pseudovulgare TaxID=35765 RepID=A0ABQ2R608_9ACTN|nr:ABC transporter permease [Streptosporangium pseudovulgare]GGQ15610.1 ABC transporter permease [Streptosporangium pseudovulgare]
MVAFIVRRVIAAVLMLAVVSAATFAIFFLIPRALGQTPEGMASRYVGRDATPEAIQGAVKRLHLDDPLIVQYGRFAKGIVAGEDYSLGPRKAECPAPCFGYSFNNNQPVWPTLLDRLPATMSLAAGAAILWLIAGVSIGIVSALRRGTALDRAAMTVALAGVSLPIYFTGLVSLSVFAYTLGIFPGGGTYTGISENPVAWFQALVLPWITLAFLYAALYARLTRAGMLETMGEDYIRTARAKGLKESTVVTKHALRATLTPILTIFGLDVGLLLGGAVLTESTFSIPGVGKLVIDAIRGNDLPVVLGVTMFAAFFIVLANLIVDILYAVVDPRVRLS